MSQPHPLLAEQIACLCLGIGRCFGRCVSYLPYIFGTSITFLFMKKTPGGICMYDCFSERVLSEGFPLAVTLTSMLLSLDCPTSMIPSPFLRPKLS